MKCIICGGTVYFFDEIAWHLRGNTNGHVLIYSDWYGRTLVGTV